MQGGIELGVMTGDEEVAYAALIMRSSTSPFTHTLAYRNVLLASGVGEACYFVARNGNNVIAALPMFVKRSSVGTVMNSLPLVQSAGGVIVADDATDDERNDLETKLLDCALNYAAQNHVAVCVFIGTPNQTFAKPTNRIADFAIDRATGALDLRQPLALHHGVREGVRKANLFSPVKHVAQTEEEALMVWQLYAHSMQRMNVQARPWLLYERLRRYGGESVRFVWSSIEGEPTTGFVLLCNNGVVDYHCVGNTELGRKCQTNSWLCLQELQWAQSRGLRLWNWGASPTAEVGTFKQRFGGLEQTYPLRGYCTEDVASLRKLSTAQLAKHFPEYFVLPYSWLDPPTSKVNA